LRGRLDPVAARVVANAEYATMKASTIKAID